MKINPVTIMLLTFLPLAAVVTGCRPDHYELPDDFDLQGHRGAMGLMPENTIPGFLMAADLNVNTMELDLAVSRDLQLVVSHEPWFRSDICIQPDGTPIPGNRERSFRIYEMTYEEVAKFDCGSLQHPGHSRQETHPAPKPLLRDVILAVEQHARSKGLVAFKYNIEVKSRPEWDNTLTPEPKKFAQLLYRELRELEKQLPDPLLTRVSVQSFDPRALHAIREIEPGLPIALLTLQEGSVDDHLDYFGLKPEIYSPNYGLLTPAHIERAHELGMQVIPWTVNNRTDMKSLVEMGVDGLITDYPDTFNRLFWERLRPCPHAQARARQQAQP